ncbi:MAG: EF-P beta-lysylation protein EpmB [Planctomycetes bacterium RBG_13_63_9]|nr:MAG: EF-P beta-lysylation protein EpmB [Planctomycetes bacterium RBG_13_63_9]
MASLASQADSPSQGLTSRGGGWQAAWAQAVRCPTELCRLLHLPSALADDAVRAGGAFGLLVPRPFLARIRPSDPDDPLLVQVMPQAAEQAKVPGYQADPLDEARATVSPGLLRKYRGRFLMVPTGACAVHCRFCFRRHVRYGDMLPAGADWEAALRQIAADESIREVILSGGDPLTLKDAELGELAGRLAEIPHLRRLRVHTRLPIVIPARVTDELLHGLRATRLTPVVVIHVNHPAEVDDAVAAALARLVDGGIPVLSQSVLLRGVNDRAEVLAELCERLVDLRVIPYYLHQLDRVAGAAHFEVPVPTGMKLIERLRARLPGYAVPRYVRETPAASSKTVLA